MASVNDLRKFVVENMPSNKQIDAESQRVFQGFPKEALSLRELAFAKAALAPMNDTLAAIKDSIAPTAQRGNGMAIG